MSKQIKFSKSVLKTIVFGFVALWSIFGIVFTLINFYRWL